MRILRLFCRLLSVIALSLSVILAVGDIARSIAASTLHTTPLGESFINATPQTAEGLHRWVLTTLGASFWTIGVEPILALPGFLVLGLLALGLYALSRKHRRKYGRIVWPA